MTTVLLFWLAFALAVMSPGPNFAVLLGTALRFGRPAAVRTALGMAIGEAVWGFGAVFGVSALATAHPWVGLALRLGGGAFLLHLGLQSLRAAWRGQAHVAAATAEARRPTVFRGLGLMLLNPKAGVFWVSLTGVLIGPGTGTTAAFVAVAGAVLISLCWHLSLALLLSGATVARLYRRVQRVLDATLGVILGGIGLKLLLTR